MTLAFLLASTVLQAAAMILAVRVAVQRRLPGWVFVAVALVLMLARRLITLHGALLLGRVGDPVAELVALLISAFLVTGLVFLSRPRRAGGERVDDRDDATLAAINRVKHQAVWLAVLALLGASALIAIAYGESRRAITDRLSRGSMDLAHLIEASAGLARSRGSDGLGEIAELWRQAKSAYPDNYLCVIGADGRLLLHSRRPERVGDFVGSMKVPSSDPEQPRTVAELIAARRDWVGRNHDNLGEEQIAAFAYSPGLAGLVAVHVPAAGIDAQIRAAAMPWALGFAGILIVVLPVSLGLLYRASSSSQAAAIRASVARRETEDRYRQIVETMLEGVWTIDAQARTTFVNARMAAMLGHTVAEMMGRPVFDFFDEDMRAEASAKLARRRQGIAEIHEFRFRRRDGSALWAALSTAPLKDAAGLYAGALALVSDVTDRRKLEDQVRHTQKMEAIGQLAGGVAHDFNNLLTVIQGNVALLQRGVDEPARRAEHEQQILDAAQRAASLTQQLLTFSRKQVMQTAVLDLNTIVARMTRLLQRILGEDVRLEEEFAPALPCIEGDAGMIEQVVMNLAVNARDAMPRGGVLRLATSVELVESAAALADPGAAPGPHVCLRVSDTGTGILPADLARIFEPFFTTKPVGKGTGLGLATVYGIVQQHHGWITVASEVGRGTTFVVRLPAAPAGRSPAPAESSSTAPLPRGTETILVVEDDPAVRPLVERILRGCGYTVLNAATGVVALEVWREQRDKIDLVLTDVVMPDGLSGRELADRLRAERPALPVILTSGYDREVSGHEATTAGELAFLPKPYLPGELARLVREQLDRGGS